MEEQKKKVVERNAPEQEAPKRLTYEQLNEACMQLSQQNQNLWAQVQQLQANLMSKRLDFLFKVLKYQNSFNSDFVIECAEEIKDALEIKEESHGEQ